MNDTFFIGTGVFTSILAVLGLIKLIFDELPYAVFAGWIAMVFWTIFCVSKLVG